MFDILLQLAHLAPPVVGLVLVWRVHTTRRWRTWALLFFSLSIAAVLGSVAFTAAWVSGALRPLDTLALLNAWQGGITLLSVAAASFAVAAVVADRSDDRPEPVGTPAVSGPVDVPRPTSAVPRS